MAWLSVQTVLVLLACGVTLMSGLTGKVPLWVAVLLVCLALLVGRL